jgi:hypothetical protein
VDARQDLALGECSSGALHLALLIGQAEVDHGHSGSGWQDGPDCTDAGPPAERRPRACTSSP